MAAADQEDWEELVPDLSRQVNFESIYMLMFQKKQIWKIRIIRAVAPGMIQEMLMHVFWIVYLALAGHIQLKDNFWNV